MKFVDIFFRTGKLQKDFNSEKALRRKYGDSMVQTIRARLGVLNNAKTLSDAPKTKPDRVHQLKGDRDEQFAVDLVHPKRLVFELNHDPIPRTADGGIDLKRVTAITVLDVVDYH